MFLTILGFIALLIGTLWTSLAAVMIGINNLPKYNLGAADNTWMDRLLAVIVICIALALWYVVISSITISLLK